MLHKKQYNNKPKPLITFKRSDKLLLHNKGTYFYNQWFSGKKGKPFFPYKASYSIPIACSIALLGGLGLMISPVCSGDLSNSAYAEGSDTDGSDTDGDYGISTQADDTLSLTLGNTVDTNADLGGSTELKVGFTVYRPYEFNVVSSNPDGYRIYVQAASGYTGSLRGLANPREEITGVGSKVAGTEFPDDTWGYYLHEGEADITSYGSYLYSTIPNNSDMVRPAKASSTTTTGQDYTLIFGARVGENKPADHYQTKVLLSLAAGATETANLSTITYMQDMNGDICKNTPTEPALGSTKQLVDKRDQKKYWVTRLKDGNCWMTQNLDFDVPTSLSPETSDVQSDVSNLVVGRYGGSGVSEWSEETTVLQYYDPGSWVYTTPIEINYCGAVQRFSDCIGYGWKEYTPGDDEHYLVGSYYSWPMATVNSGVALNTDGAIAQDSICPKGWKLPINGSKDSINNTKSGSLWFLLNKYGFTISGVDSYNRPSGSLIGDAGQNIASAPLYFVRSGQVHHGFVNYVGRNGDLWSNTAFDGALAYMFELYDIILPHVVVSRSYGFPVRCVATSSS